MILNNLFREKRHGFVFQRGTRNRRMVRKRMGKAREERECVCVEREKEVKKTE